MKTLKLTNSQLGMLVYMVQNERDELKDWLYRWYVLKLDGTRRMSKKYLSEREAEQLKEYYEILIIQKKILALYDEELELNGTNQENIGR